VEPYPFTTQFPQPGMLCFEDIAFQLVDLPPVSAQHPVPWLANALRPADGCFLVVDLGEPACVEQTAELHELLAARPDPTVHRPT
jgi:ribosome-interacting GTPase 1